MHFDAHEACQGFRPQALTAHVGQPASAGFDLCSFRDVVAILGAGGTVKTCVGLLIPVAWAVGVGRDAAMFVGGVAGRGTVEGGDSCGKGPKEGFWEAVERKEGGRMEGHLSLGVVGLMVMIIGCVYERGLNFRMLIHEISVIGLLDRKNDSNGVVHED